MKKLSIGPLLGEVACIRAQCSIWPNMFQNSVKMRKNEGIFQSYIFSPIDLCRAKEANCYNLFVLICKEHAFFRSFQAINRRKSVSKLCKSKLANSRTHHFPESKLSMIDNPEMASFSKKCKRKFEFLEEKFKFYPILIWQNFSITLIK